MRSEGAKSTRQHDDGVGDKGNRQHDNRRTTTCVSSESATSKLYYERCGRSRTVYLLF
jgi:hypothetical protein